MTHFAAQVSSYQLLSHACGGHMRISLGRLLAPAFGACFSRLPPLTAVASGRV
jgi:hypothetical protein